MLELGAVNVFVIGLGFTICVSLVFGIIQWYFGKADIKNKIVNNIIVSSLFLTGWLGFILLYELGGN